MSLTFKEIFSEAKEQITIIGLNPIAVELESNTDVLFDILNLNRNLFVNIFYESDSENFSQSLSLSSIERISFAKLNTARDRVVGRETKHGLTGGIKSKISEKSSDNVDICKRIQFSQINTRLPVNLIAVDKKLYFSISTHLMCQLKDYVELKNGSPHFAQFNSYISKLMDKTSIGIYNSSPGQELIQLYDNERYPRGIYPRSAFYTTQFKRYSVWGLVFNRNGQILLHQRSQHTKDNRLLWDKSIGGHVDLKDRGTQVTAKRELIEELFLPDDEYTKYVSADLGEILDCGEWNMNKRPESQFNGIFDSIGPLDWIMFRATGKGGEPLTIDRISERTITKDGSTRRLRTVFISDVYLFIAPNGLMDDEIQMNNLVAPAQKSGAAEDHRIVTPEQLSQWVDDEEREDNARNVFTDDLVYMKFNHIELLEEFSEFVKYISKEEA